MVEILSVRDVSEELGLSRNRIRQLIKAGRLPATQLGREYAILRRDLEQFKKMPRPHGRPYKRTGN